MEPSTPASGAAGLAALLDEPIVLVDVGARWGFAAEWDPLGDRCLAIGFDPDAAECERLAALHRRAGGGLQRRFVPLAVGPASGSATLFVTRQPACSSLYPPSPEAYGRHPGLAVITPESSVLVDLVTLDEWCAAEGVRAVDVLKVDTQGSELGVLQGAETTLAAVRAVEVEVEFNELYTGAPLFGDVDRFLRRRGFVLWRLRDLAHYGQEGADLSWRTPDVWQLDSDAFAFESGPGQLFWANAYYLRREVAYPEAAGGWRQLLRDACITGAFGFHDLSKQILTRCLEAARLDADAGEAAGQIAGALAGASPAPAVTSTAHVAPARGAPTALATTVRIELADAGFAGGGWHPPQYAGDLGFRWSGPGRDAWIDLPGAIMPEARLELLVVNAITPDVLAGLSVTVGAVEVGLRASPHGRGTLYAGTVPDGVAAGDGVSRIMVRLAATRSWRSVHPASVDDLDVGVAVSWVRVTPPGPGGHDDPGGPEGRP